LGRKPREKIDAEEPSVNEAMNNLNDAEEHLEEKRGIYNKAAQKLNSAESDLPGANAAVANQQEVLNSYTRQIESYRGKDMIRIPYAQFKSRFGPKKLDNKYEALHMDEKGNVYHVLYEKTEDGQFNKIQSYALAVDYGGDSLDKEMKKLFENWGMWNHMWFYSSDKFGGGNPQSRFSRQPEFEQLHQLFNNRIEARDNLQKRVDELEAVKLRVSDENGKTQAAYENWGQAQSSWEKAGNAFKEAENTRDFNIQEIRKLETADIQQAYTEIESEFSRKAEDMAALTFYVDGQTLNISQEQALALLDGQSIEVKGKSYDLAGWSEAAQVKTNLNKEESFVQLNLNNPEQAVTLTWQGRLEHQGQTVTTQNAQDIFGDLASPGEFDQLKSQLTLENDGKATISRVVSQTRDAVGLISSQTTETYELNRQGEEVTSQTTVKNVRDHKYDSQGNVVGYVKTIEAEGQETVTRTLENATYDSQGRLATSETLVQEGNQDPYHLSFKAEEYDKAGQVLRREEIKINGETVEVRKDSADRRYDQDGKLLFSQEDLLNTSIDDWDSGNHDFDSAAGERSTETIWNQSFNTQGQVAEFTRLTQQSSDELDAEGGYQASWEHVTQTYNDQGKLAASHTKVREIARGWEDGQERNLVKEYTVDLEINAYSDTGEVLRQKKTVTKNGQITVEESVEDNVYDAQKRLIETKTRITDPTGKETLVTWRALEFNKTRQATRFERTTEEGETITVETTAAEYDAKGRIVRQESHVEKTDKNGELQEEYDQIYDVLEFNAFDQVVLSQTETTRNIGDSTMTTTDLTETEYDGAGRVSKTTTNSEEIIAAQNGDVQTNKSTSIRETLKFDEFGRALRVRQTTSADGQPVKETTSLRDIQYDAQGRVISSKNYVHEYGVDEDGNILDKGTAVELSGITYNDQNQQTGYTRTTTEGLSETQEIVSNILYDLSGRILAMTTNITEMSLDPFNELFHQYSITQSGMTYDALGNLTDYTKIVKDGTLETTYIPVQQSFDAKGRATETLIHVTDNTGRDDYEYSFGMVYNQLGQMTYGYQSTVKTLAGNVPNTRTLASLQSAVKGGLLNKPPPVMNVKDYLGFDTEDEFYEQLKKYENAARRRFTKFRRISMTQMMKFRKAKLNVKLLKTKLNKYKKAKGAVQVSVLTNLGLAKLTTKTLNSAKYDRRGRLTSSNNSNVSIVWATSGGVEQHDVNTTSVNNLAFDSLNRVMQQQITTQTTTETKTDTVLSTYDAQGRLAGQSQEVSVSSLSGDGTYYSKTYRQTRAMKYDEYGRISEESTRNYLDSTAPLKDITVRINNIHYNSQNQRIKWSESSTSAEAPDTVEIREVSGAVYDNANRLIRSNINVYEEIDGSKIWQYSDKNAVNSYDAVGRLVKSVSTREWGDVGGGGIAGLNEGWKHGRNVKVTTVYTFKGASKSISGMKVNAKGSGKHSDGEVMAHGINFTDERKNFKYNSSGRTISYTQRISQVERYTRTESRKRKSGLGRKTKTKSLVGMNTTDSVVTDIQYDSFGRQVFSRSQSYNHGARATTSAWSRVHKFDGSGRAEVVESRSETKINAGHRVSITSGSHVWETNVFNANGTKNQTLSQRQVVDEWQEVSDRSHLTKTMKIVNVTVMVAVIVLTLGAGSVLAAMGWAALASSFQLAQTGISLHDLGVGGRDREGAKQRALSFYQGVASAAMAGIGKAMSGVGAFQKVGGGINTTGLATYAGANAAVQMGVAAASGADSKTIWQVGAIAAASGAAWGPQYPGGASLRQKIAAGIGESMIQIGGLSDSKKTQDFWIYFGGAVKASQGRDRSQYGQIITSAAQRIVLTNFQRQQAGGTDENAAIRRSLLVSQTAGLINAGVGIFVKLTVGQKISEWGRKLDAKLDVLFALPSPETKNRQQVKVIDQEAFKAAETRFIESKKTLKNLYQRIGNYQNESEKLAGKSGPLKRIFSDLDISGPEVEKAFDSLTSMEGKEYLAFVYEELSVIQEDIAEALNAKDIETANFNLDVFEEQSTALENTVSGLEATLKQKSETVSILLDTAEANVRPHWQTPLESTSQISAYPTEKLSSQNWAIRKPTST